MLTVLTDKQQIAQAQAKLTELLQTALSERVLCTVSGVGGGYQDNIAYSPELDLWYSFQALDNKFWNGLGVGQPIEGKKVALASEINFPSEGLSRAISGVFASDEQGEVFVLHRGKIRGGKAVFFQYYTGPKVEALDKDKTDEFALISSLNHPDFAKNIAAFVQQILNIKAAAKAAG